MDPVTESERQVLAGTVVGESMRIHGRLVGGEDLTLRGRLEGELTLTQTLVIEVSGIVKADIAVKSAIIRGVVVGNVTATDSIELAVGARVVGDLRAARVSIAEGACFRGRVQMGEVEAGSVSADRSQRAAVRGLAAVPRLPAAPNRIEVRSRPAKPIPPPPPAAGEARGALAPMVAEVGKKKIVVKRKAR